MYTHLHAHTHTHTHRHIPSHIHIFTTVLPYPQMSYITSCVVILIATVSPTAASTEKCDNVLYEGANAMPRGTCLTRGNEHGSGAVTCQLNAAGMKECKCTDAGQIFNRNIFTIGTSYYNRSIQDPFGRCVDAKTVCPSYNLYPGATGCDTNCVTPVPPTTGPGSIASGYTYDRTICREFSGLPVKCVASSVVGVSSCVSESSGFKCSSPNAQLSSVSGSKVLSGVRAVKCFGEYPHFTL
eukprot:TRINITY_DN1535_c0_g1_i4.p1 TRINITY_DN1535_c0_g1~~TRINITY_DN1535_c0_g1_i4.p1  ORF type:complete len:240 (+),score=29.19 TRINITY_DN1535_c0_g1_i4:2005-2724(+)